MKVEPTRKSLLDRLFAENEGLLRGFFRRRVRNRGDVHDLAQEVYVRMLGVNQAEVIRNPEAYLYTVARNLAREHAVLERRRASELPIESPTLEGQLAELPEFEDAKDADARIRRLREVLQQLSPKARTALVLQYRDGLSYAEIGARLGVSSNMVKKYLVQALAYCRKRMGRLA